MQHDGADSLFECRVNITFLPAVFFKNSPAILLLFVLPGVIMFYENRNNPKITRPWLGLYSTLFFAMTILTSGIALAIMTRFSTPGWMFLSIPALLLLGYHFLGPYLNLDGGVIVKSDKDKAADKAIRIIPEGLVGKFAATPTKKTLALVAGLAWVGYSYFVGAHKTASHEAQQASASSAGAAGYIPYCINKRNRIAENFYRKNIKTINSKYLKKEMGVVGMSLFNKLLGQSFGDRNYQNYINKYGTNPYDALTGGALSKGPKVLGKIVSGQKSAEINKLKLSKNKFTSQSRKVCACQFSVSFSKYRSDWTIYAATFKLVRPSTLTQPSFRRQTDSNYNVCSS